MTKPDRYLMIEEKNPTKVKVDFAGYGFFVVIEVDGLRDVSVDIIASDKLATDIPNKYLLNEVINLPEEKEIEDDQE